MKPFVLNIFCPNGITQIHLMETEYELAKECSYKMFELNNVYKVQIWDENANLLFELV